MGVGLGFPSFGFWGLILWLSLDCFWCLWVLDCLYWFVVWLRLGFWFGDCIFATLGFWGVLVWVFCLSLRGRFGWWAICIGVSLIVLGLMWWLLVDVVVAMVCLVCFIVWWSCGFALIIVYFRLSMCCLSTDLF